MGIDIDIENARCLIACSDMCALMAAGFDFPNADLANALVSGTFEEDCMACMQEAASCQSEPNATEELAAVCATLRASALREETVADGGCPGALRREHSRLYDTPMLLKVQPYEAAFRQVKANPDALPANFVSPTTQDVERQMRKAGVVTPDYLTKPIDSFSNELRFLSYAYGSLAHVLEDGDDESATFWRNVIEEFRTEHFDKWALDFLAKTAEETRSDVYRSLCEIAEIFYKEVL